MDTAAVISALEQQEITLSEQLKSIRQTIITFKQTMALNGTVQFQSNETLNGGKDGSVSDNGSVDSRYSEYSNDMSYRDKVRFILKAENRFLHYREIVSVLCSLDKKATPAKLKNSISPAISFLKSEKVIVPVKIGNTNLNVFWGSKNWLDDDGNIKPGHEYNEEMIAKTSSKGYEI